MNKFYLIGYEKQNIDFFINKLKDNRITTLVDVREIPLSRKKGFSKNSLKLKLNEAGIDYVHIRKLGSPKIIRHKLHEDKNYIYFFKKYRAYIKGRHIELQNLVEMTRYEKICIMCFEANCELCHRSLIADELTKMNPLLNGISI
jgi:uncharacterized protein (DUF488 family)